MAFSGLMISGSTKSEHAPRFVTICGEGGHQVSLQGRKIFITGGAGFIGSHIVEDMVAKGARVTIYDDFSSGLMSNLDSVAKDVKRRSSAR